MGIIRTLHLMHAFIQKDEAGNELKRSQALTDINISIDEGSFVAILGRNGSGKTTLARHLNALMLPTQGTVWVDGRDTSDPDAEEQIRRTAGMVFQKPDNQIIANVVEEDVGFGPENMGIPTEEILVRVDKALEAVGMTAFREASPNRLSGGQKQRVAIAGVLAMKPDCIVLDEPTAMLDPNGRKEVIKTIHELNKKENITILLITHYMEEAVDADRIIVMNDGQMAMDGTPAEIFSRIEELKALELDVPQVTELAWKLKQKGAALPDGILHKEELVEALYALME